MFDLTAGRQLPDIGGEALDGRGLVGFGVEALLDGASQTLLHRKAGSHHVIVKFLS